MPDKPDTAAKADDLTKLKRDDLNEVAAEAGVPNPDDLPNKGAVAEAIEAPNPALAPVPDPDDEPRERTYKVNGVQETLGHAPGEIFTALIPAWQEKLLLRGGHLIYAEADKE